MQSVERTTIVITNRRYRLDLNRSPFSYQHSIITTLHSYNLCGTLFCSPFFPKNASIETVSAFTDVYPVEHGDVTNIESGNFLLLQFILSFEIARAHRKNGEGKPGSRPGWSAQPSLKDLGVKRRKWWLNS